MVKNKKAQGHIEMILSFVIFIGFIVVLLFFLTPSFDKDIDTVFLETTKNILMENWSSEYSIVSLTINESITSSLIGENCLKIKNKSYLGVSAIAKGYNGISLNVDSKVDFLELDYCCNRRYYKIYFSDNFNSEPVNTGCKKLDNGNYSFGVPVNKESVFLEAINQTINEYNQDYDLLKQELNLKNDFEINIFNSTKDLILSANSSLNQNLEVYSIDFPVIVLDQKANKHNLIINIRTW
jgi:hypothetical protein